MTTFDDWWKRMKPAECDELKDVFVECWDVAQEEIDPLVTYAKLLRKAVEEAVVLQLEVEKTLLLNGATYDELHMGKRSVFQKVLAIPVPKCMGEKE